MDRSKFQYEGLKWLFELDLLNHPQAVNTIKLNVLMVSKRIKEVELLIYRENKSMLVLLDLTWMGKRFFRKQIFTEVHEVLQQLMPSFQFRVIDDPKIMQMAIERVKKALTGGKNENSNINDVDSNVRTGDSKNKSERTSTDGISDAIATGTEESSQPAEGIRPNSDTDDSKEE